ncbi:unnamed protein product [Cuscuta epithymum]|uniref:Uncharacterized protein n=1 Tax=Cuscuta epithymum TaxID=186058 RepID=A0AAV0EV21_9ASTE|nr:unnamed protein product [Cuscuta epithymum]
MDSFREPKVSANMRVFFRSRRSAAAMEEGRAREGTTAYTQLFDRLKKLNLVKPANIWLKRHLPMGLFGNRGLAVSGLSQRVLNSLLSRRV